MHNITRKLRAWLKDYTGGRKTGVLLTASGHIVPTVTIKYGSNCQDAKYAKTKTNYVQ